MCETVVRTVAVSFCANGAEFHTVFRGQFWGGLADVGA